VQEVLQLLSDSAHINEKGGPGGYTPLHTAVFRGQVKVVQNLLEHGADVSVKTSSGDSPLHLVFILPRMAGREAIIRFLLLNGADMSVKNKKWEYAAASSSFPGLCRGTQAAARPWR
jgi:ankyrin repeat protein